MELNKVTEERRSIRKFKTGVDIPEADIREIISFAQNSPSWKNSQTARYYAVLSDDRLEDFRKKALPTRNAEHTEGAALIVTTFVKNIAGFSDGKADNEPGNEWGAYDLGLGTMLLTLKAREMGYDTLIMGIRNGDAIRTELNIPDNEEVMAVVAVGKRDIDPKKPLRQSTDEILKFF